MEHFSQQYQPERRIESDDEELFYRFNQMEVKVLSSIKPSFENLKEQKAAFLSGELDCPHFQYDEILDVDLDGLEHQLQIFKDYVNNSNYEEEVVRIYMWAINERIAKVRMLKEIQNAAAGKNVEEAMHRFSRYVEYIYGKPDAATFRTVEQSLAKKLQTYVQSDDFAESDEYRVLQDILPDDIEYQSGIPQLEVEHSQEVVEDAEVLKQYFEQAVEEYGLDGWTVVIDATGERFNIAVSKESKTVKLPSSEQLQYRPASRKLTPERVRGLIKHELGTHAVRNENGLRSDLKLLSVGFDRYETGEEGLATYREQQEAGTNDYAGFDGYFAAGLAKGLDGHAERNFREVYDILLAYYQVCESAPVEKAQQMAWNRTLRTFRGTTGDIPGVIFTKDILYRKGNKLTHELFNDDTVNIESLGLDMGKFDQTNGRHVQALRDNNLI